MNKRINLVLLVTISILFIGCGKSKNSASQSNIGSQTIPEVSQKTIRVACIGDSITKGVGISSNMHTYPSQLSNIIGKGWEVRNFGVKSTTLLKSGTSPYWATQAYKNSKNYNPDIVIIMFGTNDAKHVNWVNKQHFMTDYGALIESYKNLPSQPLVYLCYPPSVKREKVGISNARILNEVIPKINQVASMHSVQVVDLYQAFYNKRGLLGDDVHPNIEGAGVIANTVYSVIY